MNTAQHKAANAIGGKTARACDSCLRKRARWYCIADDAFLCQACSTIHSANQLARKHERVRLEVFSFGSLMNSEGNSSPPAWHQGFTKRPRTPRNHGKSSRTQPSKEGENVMNNPNAPPLVPEIGSEEASPVEDEENVIFRVPVLDPFEADIFNCSDEVEYVFVDERTKNHALEELDDFSGFLPSDMDLAELAADVESLRGNDEELGFPDCKKDAFSADIYFGDKRVKLEELDEELEDVLAPQVDPNFIISSSITAKEEEMEKIEPVIENEGVVAEVKVEKKIFLKLNYEGVITAWGSQGLPWTTGIRPHLNPDDYWPDNFRVAHQQCYGTIGVGLGEAGASGSGSDSGREARVSRYREKRRTRFFSKKIRYEVRKLNAEKRPRVKGRFVKRTSLFNDLASSSSSAAATAAYSFFSQ